MTNTNITYNKPTQQYNFNYSHYDYEKLNQLIKEINCIEWKNL